MEQKKDGKFIPIEKGHIGLQAESAELLYRNIRIKELDEINDDKTYGSISLEAWKGSEQEKTFLKLAKQLSSISTIKFWYWNKSALKITLIGLSMEFDNQADYDFYSNHPEHNEFVQKHWIPR